METNSSGVESASRTYYAYGSTRSSSETLQTDRTFTGQKQDTTGLMFYHARYYDGSLGTFISPDTIVPSPQNPQTLNRYAYVVNNPLRWIDPTGHSVDYGHTLSRFELNRALILIEPNLDRLQEAWNAHKRKTG